MKTKLLSLLAIVLLSSTYSEACSNCIRCKTHLKKKEAKVTNKPSPEPFKFKRPLLADREALFWSESNLYQFFHSLYVEGVKESKWRKWIVTPESPKGSHSWIVGDTRNNVTTIIYKHIGAGKPTFPEDKATFVIDPFSETKYLEGQPFKEPIVYYGLIPYMETMLGVTNEVNTLVFFTEQGVQDALDLREDIDLKD